MSLCLVSSSLRVNVLLQLLMSHTNGLSPVCIRTWFLSWPLFEKAILHAGHWKFLGRYFLTTCCLLLSASAAAAAIASSSPPLVGFDAQAALVAGARALIAAEAWPPERVLLLTGASRESQFGSCLTLWACVCGGPMIASIEKSVQTFLRAQRLPVAHLILWSSRVVVVVVVVVGRR